MEINIDYADIEPYKGSLDPCGNCNYECDTSKSHKERCIWRSVFHIKPIERIDKTLTTNDKE